MDSLLNVPVFGNTPLTGINEDYATVTDPGLDPEAVREELMTNPVFSNAIISPDGTTGAMLVSFYLDTRYIELINRRTELANKRDAVPITRNYIEDEEERLASIEKGFLDRVVGSAHMALGN